MKIISRGAIKPRQYTCTCRSCNSVLQVDETDGERVFDQRDGDYVIVKCPVCALQFSILISYFH